MKKTLLILGTAFFGTLVNAQVGVNNEAPKATLDVIGTDNGTPKGILVPRLKADEVKAMTSINGDQNSMLVYITNKLSNDGDQKDWMELVDGRGYYYFDYDTTTPADSRWRKLEVGNGDGPGGTYKAGTGMFLKGDKKDTFERNGLQELLSADNSVNPTTGEGDYGWRYIGLDQTNYGKIGKKATDLSYTPKDYDETVPLQGIGIPVTYPFSALFSPAGNPDLVPEKQNMGATGLHSFVAGVMNVGKADFSTTSGFGNLNDAGSGVALGAFNVVKGTYSVGIGSLNKLTPEREAYVIGGQNHVSAKLSVVLGTGNGKEDDGAVGKVTGLQSVTIGRFNGNTGANAVAIGVQNLTSGEYAVALGNNLKVSSHSSVAVGTYNTEDASPDGTSTNNKKKRVFTVGNGEKASNGDVTRSDAFSVLRSSKTGIGYSNFENTTSDAKLQVNGTIKVGNNGTTDGDGAYQTNEMPCEAKNAGSIRYKESGNSGNFEGCRKNNGAYSWTKLHN